MDVLDTLVAQFTDPFACLRELIQNALDAGSDVVEINTSASQNGSKQQYVLEVQDHGCGMDRAIIDSQLTRLFSSSKDGDLTKIGKFGVGFVSVFALQPVAVCVDTARAGERWRLVFDKDRSFTRVKLDEPMEGTRVRLFLDEARVKVLGGSWAGVVTKARQAVSYWCRHVEKELLFDGQAINRPLELPDHALTVSRNDGAGTIVLAGICGTGTPQTIGFYNKGLTLVEATAWEDLPPDVSVRLSSGWLEHTLTRDSVLRDDRYLKAMKMVHLVVEEMLLPTALDTLQESADPKVRAPLVAWLKGRLDRKHKKRPLFQGVGGTSFSVNDVVDQGCAVISTDDNHAVAVGAAAAAAGRLVFAVSKVRHRSEADDLGTLCGVEIGVLTSTMCATLPLPPEVAPRAERLSEFTRALLNDAGLLKGGALALSGVVGGSASVMAYPRLTGSLLKVVTDKWIPAGDDDVVIDVAHSDVVALLALAAKDTPLAAFLLAKLMLPIPLGAVQDTALATGTMRLREQGAR